MKYITQKNLWQSLGENSYIKVRGETLGNGSGSVQFSTQFDNLISGSEAIYSDGTQLTNGYTVNYDDGFVSLTASPSVNYSIDYDYSGLSTTLVSDIINRAEKELELKTGRTFNITTTSEYIDVEDDQDTFFLSNYPVLGVNLSHNTAASIGDAPVWAALSEGLGNDFIREDNMITLTDLELIAGKQRLLAYYSSGFATIPDEVKDLAVLMAKKKLINSGIYRQIALGDNNAEIKVEGLENQIKELVGLLKKQNIERI